MLADGIGRDAALYPFAFHAGRDAVFVAPMDPAAYRAASFLDERLRPRGEWLPTAALAQAMSGARDVRPLHFIFHAGHVGSTLLSRLIDETGRVLPLREPLPLRTLAGDFAQARAELFLKLWERGFADIDAVVLKATSSTQRIAPALLALRPQAKAVMLNLGAESYLATMLAGENSTADLNAQGPERLHRLGAHIGHALPPPKTLGELIAMSWLAERVTQSAARRLLGARILEVDFDAMLAALPQTLARVLAHFGLAPDRAAQIAQGPALTRYSKAPEHGYSPGLRAQLLAQARRDFAPEIREALLWLDRLRAAHPALVAVV